MAKGLSREGIVAAALEVLDAQGIDGVTVRAVAAQLGVKAPALYYYVHNKQDLLDEMGTEIQRRVVARLRGRVATGDWLDDLVAYAGALRAVYLEHRDGARTFSGTLITDPDVLKAQEPWLRRWVAAGVPPAAVFDATEMVTAFVVGFVIEEQERLQSSADPSRYSPDERDRRLGSEVPFVSAAGHARHDNQTRFERQLKTVIAGIDRQLGS
ncbi:TetR family transcriptional regulator [Streptomyces humidus]|uniref:TetR family transcriptional regulator n=1 Tax=Streptomyces humidus TaxID=52259 RepID=A0A918L5L4_9ACTN|nr:TetR/AcrR family transcriptional regulator C-terminal domain-containing protein [Streptomyces humidus]GGS10002.1 TetR family transcriptional regulator [Streptomyces humidus]